MEKTKIASDLVRNKEITYVDYVSEIAASKFDMADGKFCPWDAGYWKMVRDAKNNDKQIIFVSGPVPAEIIYAMDCVPLYLDLLPARLSENPFLTSWLMGETDKRVNSSLCRMNKTEIGTFLGGEIGVIPDAYVAAPISCDSARTAYSAIEGLVKAPTFHFDVPIRKGKRSLEYLEAQFGAFIDFMERITDKKLDWDKLKYRIELSNRAGELLDECTLLRRRKPCPMSSHMNIWNELMTASAPTENMVKLLTEELDICNARIAVGESPCPAGEKHRVLLLHNMLWQGVDITDWLESEYGAVTVMDGYSYQKREGFQHPDDRLDCYRVMCRRLLGGTTIHGAGAAGAEIVDMVHGIIRDYDVDISIFMGSSGCRHEWASSKMLTDSIQEEFGMSTLTIDVDNTDRNYKSEAEIKSALAEYIDTVVLKK